VEDTDPQRGRRQRFHFILKEMKTAEALRKNQNHSVRVNSGVLLIYTDVTLNRATRNPGGLPAEKDSRLDGLTGSHQTLF